MSKSLGLMKQGLKLWSNNKSFDRLAKPLQAISATDSGKCKFQLTVEDSHLNGGGTLHGGFTAFLVDYTTSAALLIMERHKSGASVDMNISYMNPSKAGDVVTVETDCKKYGYNLVFMEAVFKNETTGKIIAAGKQTKFIGDGKGSAMLKDIDYDTE